MNDDDFVSDSEHAANVAAIDQSRAAATQFVRDLVDAGGLGNLNETIASNEAVRALDDVRLGHVRRLARLGLMIAMLDAYEIEAELEDEEQQP